MLSMSDKLVGKRILALTKYAENGASSRLRTLQYIPWLEAAGASVDIASFFDAAYVERLYAGKAKGVLDAILPYSRRLASLMRARHYDLLWIEKELFPWAPGFIEYAAKLSATPYILDYDDAIFHNYDAHPSAFVRRFLGGKLDPLLKNASAVMAGNAYLADYAKRHGARRTEWMPTVIDLARYPVIPPPPVGQDRVRIGWIGTPGTVKYLRQILPALEALAGQYPVTLVTIGAPHLTVTPPLAIEQHAWSEDSEAALLSSTDIGIMPLPDEPFERGKCGYKLIQYMACARPVVASPVGVNAQIVGVDTGMLADSEGEWCDALGSLCADHEKRMAMGAAGRAAVERDYCVQVTAPRMVDLFAEVMAA